MLRTVHSSHQTPTFPESKFNNPFADLLQLTPGKRYTFLIESTFGSGAHSLHIVLRSARVCRFDQSDSCVEIIFKPRGKQKICQALFYGSKAFAVWEGWLDIEDQLHYGILNDLGFRRNPDHALPGKLKSIEEVVASIPLEPVCSRFSSSCEQSARSQQNQHKLQWSHH